MSARVADLPGVDLPAIEAIVQDLFETMVDRTPGTMVPGFGDNPALVDPVHTWVDVRGAVLTRIGVAVGRATSEELTRAFLATPADAPLHAADVADALGEVVNVIGGNIKSLVDGGGSLSLPRTAEGTPDIPGQAVAAHAWFAWRGQPLIVQVWLPPAHSGPTDDHNKEG